MIFDVHRRPARLPRSHPIDASIRRCIGHGRLLRNPQLNGHLRCRNTSRVYANSTIFDLSFSYQRFQISAVTRRRVWREPIAFAV